MIDIHSHILYGIDDGAESLNVSDQMLSAAKSVGITHIIATPHLKKLPYDFEAINASYEQVNQLAQQKEIRLDLGFEVYWNALLGLNEETFRKVTIRNTRRILVEFSLSADELPPGHDQMIYRLQRCGLEIIIAHPERYRFVQHDASIVDRWKDMGCSLQLDAVCLLHSYERMSKPAARKLYKAGYYDFLASDAHCPADYFAYGKALAWSKRHSRCMSK